jgi:hypothetical protein
MGQQAGRGTAAASCAQSTALVEKLQGHLERAEISIQPMDYLADGTGAKGGPYVPRL